MAKGICYTAENAFEKETPTVSAFTDECKWKTQCVDIAPGEDASGDYYDDIDSGGIASDVLE